MNIQEVYEKYIELKTIKNTAKFLGISSHSLIKQFTKHNIPYNKKIRYICDENVFAVDNANSFYWAGFMAADGNISKQNDININLKVSDAPHLEKFRQFLCSDTPIKERTAKATPITINNKTYIISERRYAVIRIRNKTLSNSLKRFNIVPNKTKIYDIPDWIISHSLINHFLRGYFDGDGWFATIIQTKTKKQKINLGVCGNKPVMINFNNIFQKNCKLAGRPQIVKQGSIYKLSYAKQHDVANIIDFLYKDAETYLERKYQLSIKAKKLDEQTIILNLDREELLKCYNELGSYAKVAEKFNCCTSSICNYINKTK